MTGADNDRPLLDDHRLADDLARRTGNRLLELRTQRVGTANPWALRNEGDLVAHRLLMEELTRHRPDDIVLSEEGTEDLRRLAAARTWIVDPLDGTHDYPFPDSVEWAVHVALVVDAAPRAASVALPALDTVHTTDRVALAPRPDRDEPIVISGRSNAYLAAEVAGELGARLVACGSSGVKAMLVVDGTVDAYVHGSGLWEWDVCAPAAVAEAAGAVVTDLRGDPIVYNKARPVVDGLVVSRPEFAQPVRAALERLL